MPVRPIQPLEIFSQLYIGDYFADTLTFSADEHAAFRLLLLHIWLANEVVWDDLPAIARVDQEIWHEIAPAILPLLVTARSNIETWKAALKPYDGMRLPSEDWYIVRTITLERDGYRCQYCSSTRRLHVDHKIPLIRGGSNGFGNLVTSCGPCNQSKGPKLLGDWIPPAPIAD
jgi:HNH endonuclease